MEYKGSIDTQFQNAINIDYDLNDSSKLQKFIPTGAFFSLLKEILESILYPNLPKARIITGAYGTGKSHYFLVIINLLLQKKLDYFPILKKQLSSHSEINKLLKLFNQNKKKFFPVIISQTSNSITQNLILGLKESLKRNNLEDIFPLTNFDAVINVLSLWKKDYPETFKNFFENNPWSEEEFNKLIKNYNFEAYDYFSKRFPELTSGTIFNPFFNVSLSDLFESTAQSLEQYGYDGIIIIFDEFSKVLENNLNSISSNEILMLQDLAEKVNRSQNPQLQLCLISHKELTNYISSQLPKNKIDEWKAISGRFKSINISNNYLDSYEVIKSVINIKESEKKEIKQKNFFKNCFEEYKNHSIFREISEEKISDLILNIFPLHPITLYLLPKLSEMIAQNERTLFTFLSSNQHSTLIDFLNNSNNQFLTPDHLFDYFEPLFEQELINEEDIGLYQITKKILNQIKNNKLKEKLIKTIFLINLIQDFDKVLPTENELINIYKSNYSTEEIINSLNSLREDENVIFNKKSNGLIQLKKFNPINVKELIRNKVNQLERKFDLGKSLNQFTKTSILYPAQYNFENKITRYFNICFINENELNNPGYLDQLNNESTSDGLIFCILFNSDSNREEIEKKLKILSENNNRLFLLPKEFKNIKSIALEYEAVSELIENNNDNPLILNELLIYFDDLEKVLIDFINSYINPNTESSYYINGKEEKIKSRTAHSKILSNICENKFSKTPIFNNELINKNSITRVMKNNRKKVIKGLLNPKLEKNLGLSGSGPDMTLFNSILVYPGIFDNENLIINLDVNDSKISNLFNKILELLSNSNEKVSLNYLYNYLMDSESGFGLRKGLIPIILSILIAKFRNNIQITDEDGILEINENLIEQIDENPELYYLTYEEWDNSKEFYLNQLIEIFKNNNLINTQDNSIEFLGLELKNWYYSLSNLARNSTQNKNRKYKKLLNEIRISRNPNDLVFRKIPQFLEQNYKSEALVKEVIKFKNYYEDFINIYLKDLEKELIQIFSSEKDTSDNLKKILQNWSKQNLKKVQPDLLNSELNVFYLNLIEFQNTYSFVNNISKELFGLSLEEWNIRTEEQFLSLIKNLKNELVNSNETLEDNPENPGNKDFQLVFQDSNGNVLTKNYRRVKSTSFGKLLSNSLLKELDSFSSIISAQERKQILFDILKEME